MILVGSKCDLEGDREVKSIDGQGKAQKWNCPHFETSAKTRINVDEVFTELVRIVKSTKKKEGLAEVEPAGSKGCCSIA